MSEENKTVELNDEELEKINGGYHVSDKITIQAGYFIKNNSYSAIYHLPSNKTNFEYKNITLYKYTLDTATGNYVNSQKTSNIMTSLFNEVYQRIDASSFNFIG